MKESCYTYNKSFFPIKIIYTDTYQKTVLHSPEEIQSGRAFKVLAIHVS